MTLPTHLSQDESAGIGGWMILPIVGMTLTILFTCWNLAVIAAGIPRWIAILSSDKISVLFKIMTLSSFAGALMILLTAVISLVGIFRRSPAAPRAATIHFCVVIIVLGIEYWADSVISRELNMAADEATRRDFFRILVYGPIWIAYFQMSRRVRNTFRPRDAAGQAG